jgi:5'-nucleotidase / UDP-sugar diphosphatase
MKKMIAVFSILLIFLVLAGMNPACSRVSKSTRLTLLHTNDTHSYLSDIGQRATLVKQIRDEAGRDHVLLVDSGDVFTGTLYFTLDQGQSDLWFMQYLGYDAMGLGNHEFDKGPAILAEFVTKAGFPVVCANFDFSKEETLAGKISPWTIVNKGGEKYGIFGLGTENTNELSSPGKNITINDSFQSARNSVAELKKQGINKIIALTQTGWEKDLELARQVGDIDVIVGGHNHIVPEFYPTVVNPSTSPTLVVQAGAQGKYLGRLNLDFDKEGIIRSWDKSQLIAIDNKIEADAACTARLVEYQKPINEMLNTVLGKTLSNLDGDKSRVRSVETNLGNLVADAMLSKTLSLGAKVAVINGGAVRSSVTAGNISLGQVMEILPYGNYLVVIELTGQQIIAALENGVSQVDQAAGRFPQVAGMHYAWNPQLPAGSRIVTVEVNNGNGYQPLDPSARYKLVTNDFMAGGGDGYSAFKEASIYFNSGIVDYEALEDFVRTNSPLNPDVEGRIKQVGG